MPIIKYCTAQVCLAQGIAVFAKVSKVVADHKSPNKMAIIVPVPFSEFVLIWSPFLSILLCSKYLQSNFKVPGPCHSLSLGLIPTVQFIHFLF